MSGHSKWSNIKRKKEKTDSQKARIFTKIGREITVAVREGGADPSVNGKLRDIIAKAKINNVPNDNIDRIIKKACSDDKADYQCLTYEGYGPAGIALIVETLTDNRNRTAGDLRHYFDKYGGNLGQTGCVSFMFTQKGVIIIENNGLDEDKLIEDCLEVGATDFSVEDGMAEILVATPELTAVRESLDSKGYRILSAEAEWIPAAFSAIEDPESIVKMNKLLDMLDGNDDVQNVWHNWEGEQG